MYILFVILSAIFLGSYEVVKKVSLKRSSIYETLFFYCLISCCLSLIFIKYAFIPPFVDICFVFLKSIIIVVNWVLVMKAVEKLDVGITTPFSLFTMILVIVLSYFLFDEKFTWIHFGSIFFVSLGIVLLTLLDKKEKKENHFIYIVYMLIGTSLGAISAILDKYLISYREVSHYSILIWFFFFLSIIYGIIYFIKEKHINFRVVKSNYWIALTGIFIFMADLTYYISIGCNNSSLSIISILRKLSIVVATILASIFLKEKNLVKKLLILMVMLIGVALPLVFK